MAGAELLVTNGKAGVMLQDGALDTAHITQADLMAANGILHVIDGVLVPAGLVTKLNEAWLAVANIAALVRLIPEFSTLTTLLDAADLWQLLSRDKLTLFAPTDAAFAKLPSTFVDGLRRAENKIMLRDIIRRHTLPKQLMLAELRDGLVDTLDSGFALLIAVNGTAVSVSQGLHTARLTTAGLHATNGVVHAVDTVLVAEVLPAQNIVPSPTLPPASPSPMLCARDATCFDATYECSRCCTSGVAKNGAPCV